MTQSATPYYEFGPFRLDTSNRVLLRAGQPVPLTRKAFDTLVALVEKSGEVVEKDELLERLWPNAVVEESNLTQTIYMLRKALGEEANHPRYVATVPGRGYRFAAGVGAIWDGQADLILEKYTRSELTIEEVQDRHPTDKPVDLEPSAKARAHPLNRFYQVRSTGGVYKTLFLGAFVMALIAGALWYYHSRPSKGAALPPMRIVPLTALPGEEYDPAISPDGKQVAFAWRHGLNNQNIYVKMIDSEVPLPLTTKMGYDRDPVWSPDQRSIAFAHTSTNKDESGIYIVPALGGPERKVFSLGSLLERGGLDWSPDGKTLAFVIKTRVSDPFVVWLISLDTLEVHALTSPPANYDGDASPVFSPDGQDVAFNRVLNNGESEVYVTPVAGGEARRVTFDKRRVIGMCWTHDGQSIIFSSNRAGSFTLWRVPFSGGTPERLEANIDNASDVSISREGNRLVYTQHVSDSNIWRMDGPRSTRKGAPVELVASTRRDENPRLSPDGKQITFESSRSGSPEIWLCDSEGADPIQLTSSGGAITGNPRFSPDGRQIAFDSPLDGNAEIYLINAAGGEPRRLTVTASNNLLPSWSRDGRWVYIASDRSGTWQVWKMPVEGGEAVQVTKNGGYEASESPDGRFLYYTRYKTHVLAGVYRASVDGGDETFLFDLLIFDGIGLWTVTNDGIYFIKLDDGQKYLPHPVINFFDCATHKVTQAASLDKDPICNPGLNVSPDGQWIIYSRIDYRNVDLMLVENLH